MRSPGPLHEGSPALDKLLRRIRARLAEQYGERLRGMILFGAEARGEATADSDVDLMVLLAGPVDTGREIREITSAIYRLQLEQEIFRPVQVLPVDVDDYQSVNLGIYRNVKEEGIQL